MENCEWQICEWYW